jgi:citrate synthase
MTGNLITAPQVAERLGVQVQTIYAYVSRGLLTRTVGPDGRTSLFDAAEVERLGRRGRPRSVSGRRAGAVDVVLATRVTALADGTVRYRGHDVAELAGSSTFEQVAELLWTGDLVAAPDWPVSPAARPVAAAVARALPPGTPVCERLAAVTAAVAGAEPLRIDLRPPAVADQARRLIRLLAGSLPRVGPPPVRPTGRAADRPRRRLLAWELWPRLSPLRPSRPRVRALDAALVLLADHELATSTLAARVAASTRAAPHAVVLAGLGALSGPLHGRAPGAVQALLDDAAGGDAERAVAGALARGSHLPGFGHPVHRGGDPRATHLLALLDPLLTRRARDAARGVRAAATRVDAGPANVDFALGVLGHVGRFPPGTVEAVMALARTAGWIAHALEEYGEPALRFRPRALYTGD